MIPAKLVLKMIMVTLAIIILPVGYSIYQLIKGNLYGFMISWWLAGVIMFAVMFFYVGQKFRAYLESQESHEVS